MKQQTLARPAGEVLRLIDEATAASTGQDFFDAVTRNVTEALGVRGTFVAAFSDDQSVAHVLSFFLQDHHLAPYSFDVAGTTCEVVLSGEVVAFERRVADHFPKVRAQIEALGSESYLAIPLKAPDGRVMGHLAVFDVVERNWRDSDISTLRVFAARASAEIERKLFEGALQAANDELHSLKDAAEEANRAKSEFLATMSHELRTPLNGILGYAQILNRASEMDVEQRQQVGAIERCAEHLLALIGDVLDLARVEAGRLELHRQEFALGEFLESVVDLSRLDALRAGLGFSYEVKSELPGVVEADERRLRQILLNLLGNAVKFTDQGSVTLRVESRPLSGNDCLLRLEVEDTGIGVPAGQFDGIFDRFVQPGDRPPARATGTGLGLTISRRLARAMGGDIRVDSRVGKGSRFTADVTVSAATSVTGTATVAPSQITGYSGPRRHVLLVDDQPDNRDVIHTFLRSLGFNVEEAADGPAALECARRRRPDMMLLDLVMPGMSGFEVIRQLQAMPESRKVPVIAVSATAREGIAEESLAAGFTAFVPKPVRFEALLDAMGEALGLEWTRTAEIPAASCLTPAAASAVTAQQRETLASVYELARRGDVRAIQAKLGALPADGRDQDPMIARLRSLAEHYDMKAIRRLLTPGGDIRR